MANMFRVHATGLEAFKDAGQVVFDAVKEAMDEIRDDVITVTESLAPRKTGKLERSHYVRRYYKNLDKCYFTISYKAINKGFNYATWTHDENYNLGAGSRRKRPARSRFAKGTLRVGTGYVSQVIEASQDAWVEHIAETVNKKLNESLDKNGRK